MSKETEVMEEFLSSLGDEGWQVNEKGEMFVDSDDGESKFIYIDHGYHCKSVKVREIGLRKGDNFYRLLEYPLAHGPVYIFVMPFKDNYDKSQLDQGIFYGIDGVLNLKDNPFGVPNEIDMDKTVELFLKQVIEKRFSVPELVKLER